MIFFKYLQIYFHNSAPDSPAVLMNAINNIILRGFLTRVQEEYLGDYGIFLTNHPINFDRQNLYQGAQ